MSAGNPFGGGRATPGFEPSPNSEPLGAKQGVPPRVLFRSLPVTREASEVVLGTPENRVVTLTAPTLGGWRIAIGGAPGLTFQNGNVLPPGIPVTLQLVGLQKLFAITDAPVPLPLQLVVAPILMAERQRLTE